MVIKWYLFKCHRIYLSPSCHGPSCCLKASTNALYVLDILWDLVFVSCKKKNQKQVKESKVVRLLQKVGEISLVWSPPEADGPVCHPPAKPGAPTRGRRPPSKLPSGNPVPNSAHRRLRSSVCLHLFHSQMTGTKRDYKNREQVPFFYFIINCTRYCIFVQIKMSQTSVCPLFASHRSLLNQMFLIL